MHRVAFFILKIFANVCVLQMITATKINPLRIIDGEVTKPNQYPSMVVILLDDEMLCGGSLISHRYILTAAHCVARRTDALLILGAHEFLEDEPTQIVVEAEEFIPHEDYSAGKNDIAIIKLSKPVEFSDVVNIVALPTRADINKDYTGSMGTVMGWGRVHYNESEISESDTATSLRHMKVVIAPRDECVYIKQFKELTDMDLCAFGLDNHNPCSGDSGGPLVHDNVLIGIVSRVTHDCSVTAPAHYINVAKYLDWIEENSDVTIGCK